MARAVFPLAEVVLFTDLANQTANRVYQRLGFVAVRDHQTVRFGNEVR